jgi:putative salt-induced outer membrane protein YdiY
LQHLGQPSGRSLVAIKSAVIAFLVVFCVAASAQDSIDLKSGETVTGRLAAVDREGATVVGAGERATLVRWGDAAAVRSAREVTLHLANGDRVTLAITGIAEGILEGRHPAFGAVKVPIASLGEAPPPAPPAAPAAAPAPAQPPKGADEVCCPGTPLTPKPLKGKVAFSGTVRSGNVDSVLTALHAEATKDCSEDRLTAAIDALYGKTDEELSAASVGGKARWDHFYSKTFYSYASAEALYDDIQNLDLRAIVGIGAGDFLWKCNEDRSWSVEAGISALYEDFSTSDDAEFSPAARVGTTYKEILFEDLKLEEQAEILVPLNDFGRYLARSRTTLGVPLCKDLALRLSLEITYQGDPPDDTDALDILGLVGIEYQF